MKTRTIFGIATLVLWAILSVAAQEAEPSCPMHAEHAAQDSHHAGVDKRGDEAMGFPRERTTHHFRLRPDGGIIEITVNNLADTQNRGAIRGHLKHIAVMFTNGDFSTPMFIHDRVPPGVPVMKTKKIAYRYEPITSGGQIVISSSDPEAVAAVHDFLRFQIEDHRTGDELK